MPEGPEVKRYADELHRALAGAPILDLSARTKDAKAWLATHVDELRGRRIDRIFARGKNIVGLVEGEYYFYSHQMMWGRWTVFSSDDTAVTGPPDRRERARVVTAVHTAILTSAPIFRVGQGDPFTQIEYLRDLGPDAVVPEKSFDSVAFLERLLTRENKKRFVGGVLLDQSIVAGIGNYLRAEILFLCQMDPWRTVSSLSQPELYLLCKFIPRVCFRAYRTGGFTVTPSLSKRMSQDPSLVYVPGKEYGTRHYVFRRTNLPCLLCSTPIRQLRQPVFALHDAPPDADELARIVYFCPSCQNVEIPNKKPKRKELLG